MITEEQALRILESKELRKGVEAYQAIRRRFEETDVSSDRDFWRVFRAFYRLRRNDEFAGKYFALMQSYKGRTAPTFSQVFSELYDATGRCEVSFSSKLLNLLDPATPIWDSIVATNRFGFKMPYASVRERNRVCIERYEAFKNAFLTYVSSAEGQNLIALFDRAFPDSGLSDTKKVDFILWKS